jgi:hypothetical protein
MSPALRPATVEAIASFRRRRTKLLRRRAGIAAIIVLLLLLLVVALLDRATFMPDQWRMGLSYLGYGVAIIAAWRLALRFVKEANAEEGAAVLLEKGDPELHEKLLSAVELAHESKTEDSEEFRGRLQDDVAGHLTGFDARKVLPNSLLWPWVKGLCAVILLLVGLSFIPGLHLPGFMARAALPFANIGRPSSTKVRIVQPAKPDALVPIASSVPVGVQIEGKIPKRVLVETLGEGGKRFRTELSSAGANRYEGSVGIGQSSVKYRVIAGDAITAWHTLEARPRPRIVEFNKTITPPAYTGLPARTVTEDHGDVSALDGSTVKLTLRPNQAISESAATLLPDAMRLDMKTHQENTLGVDIPVNGKSDSWQLALKLRETGFNNEESAPWRIETLADIPPSIAITDPKAQMEVQVDDIVPVSGSATDDIGLAKIEMSYAINATGWKATTLKEKAGKETTVTSPFKLAPLPVKTGDSVLVKLIATDVKGQAAESAPVRFFIVENKLNLAQREWASQQRQLAQQAQALNEEMRDLRKESERVRSTDRQKQRGKEQEDADAALAKMKQSLASVQEKSEELWEKLKDTAQQAPDALKAMDANLGGQKLAEMRGHHLKELQEQAQAVKIDERQLKDAANRAAQDAEQLAEALRAFAAADTAQAAKESMEHLAPQQNRLADKAMDANRNADERPKWQEQQRAALAAAQNAKKDLENLKEVIRSDRQREVNNHIENFSRKMPALEASLDKPQQTQSPEYVYGQSHEMRNAANQARDASRWLADETAQRANEQRERLMQQQNPALAALDQARDLAQQASSKRKEDKNEEPRQQQAADKLTAAARQLKDQSEMREQNHQTNHQTALDQNRMGRALDSLADQMKHAQTPEEVKQIAEKAKQLAEAARALEADAKAQDAANSLQQAEEAALAKTQQEQQLAAARAAASQLKDLPRALKQAQSDDKAAQAAQEAAQYAQWQRDETQNQQRTAAQMKQNGQEPPKIPADQDNALKANANAQQKLAESMEHFAPKVAEARKTLEGMTPKLSELAKNAAQDVKQSQQQTEQVAKAAENNQPAQQTAQDANALMPKANQDGQKLTDLQAALRQEADKADLTSEAQRQMARTADVGLAQMRQQTPQIAQNLQQAAKSQESAQQAKSLQNAAKAQQQTAQGLEQLAKNLSRMEQGEMLAQDALDAQQAMEEALGIKQPLDQAYSEAENLAKLMEQARENPNEALAMLEKELKQNPQMQRALGVLAEQTAQESQQALAQAKDQPVMAQPAQEQEGHDLGRVARHEDRLDQKAAAQQVGQASQQIQQMAKAAKADPAQNTPQNAQQAAQVAQEAQHAASEAAKSQIANTPAPNSFLDSAKGALLAQALDQIDQVLNLSPAEMQARQQQQGQQQSGQQQQGQQQGQQPGQQSSQQQAQQNLAQANQAQAQSMAQARAQGMVPGQQPQQQQANQQGKNQEGQGQASQDATGNLAQTQAQLLVPVIATEQGGDWGHLPSRMAKDLTEASRQELSPEYRAAIESYYKAISEKAKK